MNLKKFTRSVAHSPRLFSFRSQGILGGLGLLLASTASAFTIVGAGTHKGFQDATVTILINQSSCPNSLNLRRLVEDAVKAWNGVPTSKLVLKAGDATTSTTSALPPVAYCDSTMTGSTLGQGGGSYGNDGYISAAFIRVNTNPSASGYILNQTDTQQIIVVAHELGHMFSLGHTMKEYSLMYYSISEKTDLGLSQDDIDGVSYLYPRNELGTDKMMGGCGSIQAQNPPNDPTFLTSPVSELPVAVQLAALLNLMILIVPLVAFLLLRRRALRASREALAF